MSSELSTSHLSQRLETIEHAIKQLQEDAKNARAPSQLFPSAANLFTIREMFLLEVIRESGLLERVDLKKIEENVRERYTGDKSPWAPATTAEKSLKQVLGEIAGN